MMDSLRDVPFDFYFIALLKVNCGLDFSAIKSSINC